VTRTALSQLGEFGWLHKLIPRLYWPSSLNSQLCIGPGDDAGVLRITRNKVLVATTDTLAEGVHFERRWLRPRDLGKKLLAVNLSDLAAMGNVKPLAALITVSLPGDTAVETVDKFYEGLRSCAQRWKIGFLGGDTIGSRRDWVVSATVLGEADPRHIVRRSGARKGDFIGVVGPLGMAAAGLEVLKGNLERLAWVSPLVTAFSTPEPQVFAGEYLGKNGWATSMIDVSDGLEASIRLLADASHLGAHVDLDALPVSAALKRWAQRQNKDPLGYVLRGGEDYALVFTASPKLWPRVQRALPAAKRIGLMTTRKAGCWAVQGRRRISLNSYGYSHF